MLIERDRDRKREISTHISKYVTKLYLLKSGSDLF